MKLSKFTRKFLGLFLRAHKRAIVADCKCADNASEAAFKRASHQLDLVRAAKDQLRIEQDKALQAQGKASAAWSRASNELDALESVGLYV